MAVRWHLRYSLSYRDVEELLAERGIDVDHAVDQYWRVIDVLLSEQRDTAAARRFVTGAPAPRAAAGRGGSVASRVTGQTSDPEASLVTSRARAR